MPENSKVMRKIIKAYRLWKLRRLYRKLFSYYMHQSKSAYIAGDNASAALQWLTGRDWSKVCIGDV